MDKSIAENGNNDGSENGIYWMSINSDYHWQVPLYNATIGEKPINITAKNIIFDTGSSLNYVPTAEFRQILNAILEVRDCDEKSDGFYYCPCDLKNNLLENYPTVAVQVGQKNLQHWFYLEARDYFIYDKYYKKCLLTIQEEPNGSSFSTMWLMGDPFLRKYYSIYDMDTKRIGLVGVANSTRIEFEDVYDETKQKIEEIGGAIGESVDGFLSSLGFQSDDIVVQAITAIVSSVLLCCCCWSCQRIY